MKGLDFEGRLISGIQPIRYSVLASALYTSMRSGLLATLAVGPVALSDLADRHDMEAERLEGLLVYLGNEGYVACTDGSYALTGKGRDVQEFEPWYALLVGGYAGTINDLGATLRKGAAYANRNGSEVGRGSCGISEYDAIPLVRDLLSAAHVQPFRFIDIGCGNGAFLLALLRNFPDAGGVGVDPDPTSIGNAGRLAREAGLDDRCEFVTASGTQYAYGLTPGGSGRDCYVASFVLQEILEQDGEQELLIMLRTLFGNAPDASLAVVEVDHRPDDPAVMRHGLGNAYYNPYYLIHRITSQRLERREFWTDLFARAGLRVAACRTVDPAVDSTGLEFGYLLVAS